MPYIPHTDEDTQAMLASIGAKQTQDLFDEIPSSLLYGELKNIPAGLSEMAMLKEAQRLADKNQNGICLLVQAAMSIISRLQCGILHHAVSF
ncbi:glycine dehydrogenase subunit 1 [Legionella feeleii]|uniref:Glycine dehydrogenase subunit 1 n=1 Tax=Legionella feeleii TaxID=453 RepID=A0A2X1RR63_9GAMM|nr:glycine dehydrogenase subunit 1 [Legionella feeleii]